MRFLLIAELIIAGCCGVACGQDAPPDSPREFRAVWVATLDNIDWPSRSGLSTSQQQQETLRILDRAEELHLNAVILQVRSAADAIYPSQLEPWSRCLTGVQGKAPEPVWDPLQFWIEQAHLRGLELHAWMNPCRAHTNRGELADSHIARRQPELVQRYGNLLWMDPGRRETLEQTLNVASDILRRYDVDGLHVDDYFYPYPVEQQDGQIQPFPDDDSWQLRSPSERDSSRADWRRANVNRLVQGLWKRVVAERPEVRFGISPFGIGRPGRVPGITGFDQYAGIYADPELWLQQGWCDYMAPQLYWSIDLPAQSFPVLLKFWQEQSAGRIPIWPGLLTSRVGARTKQFPAEEILRQVAETRKGSMVSGQLHFSMNTLMKNPEHLADRLKSEVYAQSALAPVHQRAPGSPLAAPQVRLSSDGPQRLQMRSEAGPEFRGWAVWLQIDGKWQFTVVSPRVAELQIPATVQRCHVTAVSRTGLESRPTIVRIPQDR